MVRKPPQIFWGRVGWFKNNPKIFGVGWGGFKGKRENGGVVPRWGGWGGFFSQLMSSFTFENARLCIYVTAQTLVSFFSLNSSPLISLYVIFFVSGKFEN